MHSTPELDVLQEARRHADQVHSRLVELGATVATAESLTGGMIGAPLTEAPATSATFRGGLIGYAVGATGVAGPGTQGGRPVGEVLERQLDQDRVTSGGAPR